MNEFGPNSEKTSGMLSFDDGSRCPGPDCLDLVVQGKQLHYHGARDVRALLESRGENPVYANVRINGQVLSRRDFENISLRNGDEIDFLYFMGGGSCLTLATKKYCDIRGTSSFQRWVEPDSRN